MRKLLLLRPEPGLSASAERARALGLDVIICPLFVVERVEWDVPDPKPFDALLLTSANAVRHGGAGLEALADLPVWAVGETTAEAARAAGFAVERVGGGGAEELLADAPQARLLHLSGEDHRAAPADERRIVYRSRAVDEPGLPALDGMVVAVHSPRAGRRLAELTTDRNAVVAAISPAAAGAVGGGWKLVDVAANPNDAALLALAARLCQKARG
jgi:uroporphyrinogen-III synthase